MASFQACAHLRYNCFFSPLRFLSARIIVHFSSFALTADDKRNIHPLPSPPPLFFFFFLLSLVLADFAPFPPFRLPRRSLYSSFSFLPPLSSCSMSVPQSWPSHHSPASIFNAPRYSSFFKCELIPCFPPLCVMLSSLRLVFPLLPYTV